MTHDLAIQEAKEASSARKAIGQHLPAYLDKEIGRRGGTTPRVRTQLLEELGQKHEPALR